MLRRILFSYIIGLIFVVGSFAQSSSKLKNPIHYRLLMTSINIEDVQPDEISISLNAFNTGRKPIDLSEFNSVPDEMEIKFEESFYRSSLSGLESEILNGLLNKNIVIPNGKILRNIRFNLPSNESLYKQLTKKDKRYSKNYSPKKRNSKAAQLKYKTSDQKLNPPPSFIAKKKKKKSNESLNKKEEKVAASINTNKANKKIPNTEISDNSTRSNTTKADVEKEMKEKEVAALEMKEQERKALEMKNKEMEAIKMKEKEMAALELKEKERKEMEMKNKEMEAVKMKEKEMAALELKEKERKEMEMKNKEMEAVKMKEKEMAALELKEKERKEMEALEIKEKEMAALERKEQERKALEMKNKEMEAIKMKEKELAENEKKANETNEPQKKEKLSIIERQKLKRKEREEAKQNEYKIDKASQKEDEKAILESLGVGNSKDKSKKGTGVAFDTKASVEASKNSYAEKAICPDLVLNSINVIKKSKNWVTLEYTLTNKGKGPANLAKSNNGQGVALRAFLSSSENISRGALPLGGGFVNYDNQGGELYPNNSYTGTLKLDIRKMTRFTPFVIINLDPFNVIEECDKTNNYGNVKVGG